MRTVRQLLEAKGAEVYSIDPDEAVVAAIRMMSERRVGALLVMEGPRLVGIVSERDYAWKVVLQGRSATDTPVRDIMTVRLVTVGPLDSADRCMQIVTHSRIRHLPVLENGNVIGVVSIGDLLKSVIEEQKMELDQLQRYIAS